MKHAAYKEKFEKEKAKAESASKTIISQPLKQSTVMASFSKSSHDARDEFVLDFIKMCTQADIPFHTLQDETVCTETLQASWFSFSRSTTLASIHTTSF